MKNVTGVKQVRRRVCDRAMPGVVIMAIVGVLLREALTLEVWTRWVHNGVR